MTHKSLSVLLREALQYRAQQQYAESLRKIREAKLLDLNNIYLSVLEQMTCTAEGEHIPTHDIAEREQLYTLIIERAISDNQRRMNKLTSDPTVRHSASPEQEKAKNLYFQRTNELLERKEYERALEEVRRIYVFDASDKVAKEYEQKIEQLIMLKKQS